MRANAPPPTGSSRVRSRAACAAWLRPARSPFPERTPVRLAVIGAVALHLLRLLARASALAPDGRDVLDQSQQLRDVVAVRTRQARRERDALPFDQQVVLASQLGAIYGTFPGLLAAVTGSDAGAVNNSPLPGEPPLDRKSTRLNSSHTVISYAVFCLKKKKQKDREGTRGSVERHLSTLEV